MATVFTCMQIKLGMMVNMSMIGSKVLAFTDGMMAVYLKDGGTRGSNMASELIQVANRTNQSSMAFGRMENA